MKDLLILFGSLLLLLTLLAAFGGSIRWRTEPFYSDDTGASVQTPLLNSPAAAAATPGQPSAPPFDDPTEQTPELQASDGVEAFDQGTEEYAAAQ
jgi:hypothetical protein